MIGRTLSHYRVLEPLGAGGMGAVYVAFDLHLERKVALKVLPEGALADETARRRFRREALALSRLNHPNIATVYDFDAHEGVDFLAMELVEGASLAELLRHRGALPEAEAVAFAAQIADALEAAHGKGVIHRDLKPSNVMVDSGGRAKVLDFGLARLEGASDRSRTLTDVDVAMGTLPYMAPEQVLAQRVDGRADVYALGVVLFEMVTGRSPYQEKAPTALVYEIVHGTIPAPRTVAPHLSAHLESVVVRCLEKDPKRRHPNAAALADDLRHPERLVPVSRPARRQSVRTLARAGAAALIVATLALAFDLAGVRGRLVSAAGGHGIRSLAVLPLENLSRDSTQEFFVEGMTDELTNRLAQIGSLTVIARGSAAPFRRSTLPVPTIARRLHCDALVTGSVLRAGARARIAAQLVRGSDGVTVWADSYEGDLGEVLALQNRVARAIADKVRARLTPVLSARLAEAMPVNADAHELYLKARYYWTHFGDVGAENRAIALFKQALDRDPGYAPAWAGLADTYYDLSDIVLAPNVAIPLAREAARKAVELDESLAEAHSSLAVVKTVYDWDWPGAEREYRRAIELNPNSAEAHIRYGEYLVYRGRDRESAPELTKAYELDPLSHGYNITTLWPWYFTRPEARRPNLVITKVREFIASDSSFAPARVMLGLALALRHEYGPALAAIGDNDAPFALAYRATILAEAGQRAEAERVLRDLVRRSDSTFVSPSGIAQIYAALGDKDQAFRWLERAFEAHAEGLCYLRVDPMFDPLRDDPRFLSLMRRVGLA
jgi:serine/threonine-protein kinase